MLRILVRLGICRSRKETLSTARIWCARSSSLEGSSNIDNAAMEVSIFGVAVRRIDNVRWLMGGLVRMNIIDSGMAG